MNGVPRTLLFDVNETLLDLAALDPVFVRAFGDAGARREWFDAVVRTVLLGLVLDRERGFGEIGQAALAEVADRRGVRLLDETRHAVREGMRALPLHPDVLPALQRLRDVGFALAALSNNPIETLAAQFDHADLRPLLDHVLSAGWSGRLKPHPDPYRMATDRLGHAAADILFVAAHGWDIAGAANVGLRTAFVARPGQALDPLAPAPDLVVPNVAVLADVLIGSPEGAERPRGAVIPGGSDGANDGG